MSENNGIQTECCEDTVVVNPKQFKKPKRRFQMFDWTNKRNPLIDQFKDGEALIKVFEYIPEAIPYRGNDKYTGHSALKFFLNIVKLSATHGSCISKLAFFTFGGKIGITQQDDDVFDLKVSETEVSESEKSKFVEAIKSVNLNFPNIKEFAENLFLDFKAVGDYYYTLDLTDSLGIKGASMNTYSPEDCMCLNIKGSVKYIAISKCWEYNYLVKNPPEIIPVFPDYKLVDGGKRTIFHGKNGDKWYGEPDSISSFQYQYREFQDVFYLMRQSDKGFTGEVFIEVEEDAPNPGGQADNKNDDPFGSTAERMEQNWTQKGEDPMSIFFTTRPVGASPAFVKQFAPNTKENFYQVMGDMNRLKIIESHGLSERLMGESVANGFSADVYMEEFKLISPMINRYQNRFEFAVNTPIKEVMKWLGLDQFLGLKLQFQSPYEVIKEESGTDNSTGDSTL